MPSAFGYFTIPGSTGNYSVTGLGFEPVAVLFDAVNTGNGDVRRSIGATDGTNQWAFFHGHGRSISASYLRKRLSTTAYCIRTYTNLDVLRTEAAIVSLDADGFTLNFTAAPGVDTVSWVAIGGTAAYCGTFTAGASTGTTAVTDPGFTPNGMFVVHDMEATTDNGMQTQGIVGFGAASGPSNQFACCEITWDASDGRTNMQRTDRIACAFDGGTTYKLSLDSWDTDGFTVNCDDAYAAIEHGYLCFATESCYVGNTTIPTSTGVASVTGVGFEPGVVMAFAATNGDDGSDSTGNANPNARTRFQIGMTSGPSNQALMQNYTTNHSFGVSYSNLLRHNARFFGVRSTMTYADGTDLAYAVFDSIDSDGFSVDYTLVEAHTTTYGYMCLPGALEFVPQIYRLVRR